MATALATECQEEEIQFQVDETELQCTICVEYFSDVRVPRNLNCGHSLCTLCINQHYMKKQDKHCPECRLPFRAKSVSDLTVNYPLLRLSRSVVSSHGTVQGSSSRTRSRSNSDRVSQVIIDDNGSGPVWRESSSEFTCTISAPKKQIEYFGMKNYMAYKITPSFSSKHVLRRYKQFDMVQQQLKIMFPLVALPPLPEKQVFGRFSDSLINYRIHRLQFWIDRICQHPVLSQSDIFRLFITVSNEKLWKTENRKMNNLQIHRSFLSRIELPQSSLDLQQINSKLQGYTYFIENLNKSSKELQCVCWLQAHNYQTDNKHRNNEVSQAFMKFSQAFDEELTSDASRISALALHVSEAYSNISVIDVGELQNEWLSLRNILSEYQGYTEELTKILCVVRMYMKKAHHLEHNRYHDAMAASCVFQSEATHFCQQLERDIKVSIKEILLKQIKFYQRITEQLSDSLEKIANEGNLRSMPTPTSPPMPSDELFSS